MFCVRKVNRDYTWVGADDRRLAMFEGVYGVRDGVSYNSYLLLDDKTVLFDTVDRAVTDKFFENVEFTLAGRTLDYLIVQHMEPDHAACIADLVLRYPQVKIVCSAMTKTMLKQFFRFEVEDRAVVMQEGGMLETGHHTLTFLMAPMVHWPEVMMTYDATDKILFSADAFGTFGALNGHLFADEVDFMRDYLDEARRYYTNIVGKYGDQVQAILKKTAGLELAMVCPLHGFVWRSHFGDYLEKYQRWSTYTPEEQGVLIAYASVYGNTENAANLLACRLAEKGVPVKVFDTSVIPASYILADCFQYSHLVFAATTYNAGIFISMDELLRDLESHKLRGRKVAFLENGSWAPTSGGLMADLILSLPGMERIAPTITVKSSVKAEQMTAIEGLADQIARDIRPDVPAPAPDAAPIENKAFFSLSYGLFVLTAKDGKDNGCIINTAAQLTSTPQRMSITVNKANHTHDMIQKTGEFNVSVLTEEAPFAVFQRFGFHSGRDTDKFDGWDEESRSHNGLRYLGQYANAFFSCRVIEARDCGTHTLFLAEVTEARVLSAAPSITYAYYFAHVKPKPAVTAEKKKGFICKICGYIYEGDTLPADFICPVCKHGAEDFEPLN
ncbi:MAG: flavin reductase [Oscillospiraceae bacterium]|nr:flavin reductase [Oscillospiraceae bacterium]